MTINPSSYFKALIYTIIVGLAAVSPAALHAQGPADEEQILEAIRSGKLKITDEMIEAQRLKHPEMRGFSNQEIRQRIEERANAREAAKEEEPLAVPPRKSRPKTEVPSTSGSEVPSTSGSEPASTSGSEAASTSGSEAASTSGSSRFPAGLKRFGYDFFVNNSAGSAGGAAPALPDYILSPNDELQVNTWGRENQSRPVILDKEGMFHFPPLQPIRLAGMRFEEAQRRITAEVEKIHGLKASVSLGRLRSMRVMVLGEVASPGSLVIPAGSTVTSALFQSGGITDIGSLRAIQVRRGGQTLVTLDLYDMLLRGRSKGDIQLLNGDAVFVPVAAIQVALTGMVKRPAIYEVRQGTKVLDALELAGGLSSNAFKGRVRLDRVEGHNRKVVLDISMERVGGASNPTVTDGDVLFVDQVLDKEFDVVYLKGNVNRPGRYEHKKGMTIKDLIPSRKELKSETFFKFGHIKRSAEQDERALLIPFSLEDVLEKGTSVSLEPRDTVIVYSRYDIMDQPMVKAVGMVRRPGAHAFVDQMRMSDLIIASGGLTVDAFLQEAHLLRLLQVSESDSLHYSLMKVNLSGVVENPGDENNFELKPFDSLIVFPRSNFILPKKVTVHGAVKRSGEFDLSQNMGIRELISQADGLTKGSYTLVVEVVRRRIIGDSLAASEIHQVNLRDILDGKRVFVLEDGDGVYVREVINSRKRSAVTVNGEFSFPGPYEIASGERLSSVIRRAGGFTPHSYLRGAVFIRQSVKEQQIKHVEEISRRLESQMGILMQRTTDEKERATIQAAIEHRKRVLEDIRNAPYLGRVVIQMDIGLRFAGGDWDIILENGDSLWVGPNPTTVSVMGEVFSPTNLVHSSATNSIGECLGLAGGVNQYGDKSSIYYILPDGTVKTPRNTSFFGWRKVEPGGSIIVPPMGPKKDYLDVMAKMTQIIYQIAISVGVAVTVF